MKYNELKFELFNKFQGFGGNMYYMYRSNQSECLFELRLVHNSIYSVSSSGQLINDSNGIKWYDCIVIDLEAGEPNSEHFLLSIDEIQEKFNIVI